MGAALYLLVVLLLPVAYILACEWEEKRKSSKWEREAITLDFSFRARERNFEPPHAFPLFEVGALYETRNVLEGEREGSKVLIAEYTYRVRFGPALFAPHATLRQTVFLIENPNLSLPTVSIFPPVYTNRVGYEPAGPEVDFTEDSAFANAYQVQGEEEAAIRAALSDAVRDFFKTHRDRQLHVSAAGTCLLVHSDGLLKPEQISDHLKLVLELVGLWTSATNAAAS